MRAQHRRAMILIIDKPRGVYHVISYVAFNPDQTQRRAEINRCCVFPTKDQLSPFFVCWGVMDSKS